MLGAIGLLALLFGPFATYQLTRTAERSPALLLADVAVGWSMIAAGLIIADRRPGNRIGPLAILTGFAWFVGDFTNSDVAVVAYLAILAHGWFDPFRVGHPGLPDGPDHAPDRSRAGHRLRRRPGRLDHRRGVRCATDRVVGLPDVSRPSMAGSPPTPR